MFRVVQNALVAVQHNAINVHVVIVQIVIKNSVVKHISKCAHADLKRFRDLVQHTAEARHDIAQLFFG